VLDPNAAAIVEATVTAKNVETGIETIVQTNSEGLYHFANLEPGNYEFSVSKRGFKVIVKPGVTLHVTDTISMNFNMQVGDVRETVTVEAGVPLISTESATVSTVVDRQFVENIPLNGRSFQTLILLTPGVVLVPTSYTSQGQFSVNGQRSDANYFTVDGVSANTGIAITSGLNQTAGGSLPGLSAQGGTNSLVSVDAMQEFRIQTSSFAPEFGRAPGGQVSMVTRSGTNQFHGTAFDYLRNDVFDANDWFSNRNGLPKAEERQNDFGGVLGGRIIKDKTFFFFSYEGLRLRQPVTTQTLVPDLASRQSAPAGIQPLLNAFPLPSASSPFLPSGLAQLNTSFSNPSTLNAYSIRIDHSINSALTLFARYNYSPSNTAQRDLSAPSKTSSTSFATHTMTLGLNVGFSPNLSNEARFNYSNVHGTLSSKLDNFDGAVPLPDSVMFPPGTSSANSLFSVQIRGAGTGGTAALFAGNLGNAEQRQVNILDNLAFTVRRHQLKFGVDYRWLSPIADNPLYGQTLVFLGVTTGSSSTPPSGYALSGKAILVAIQAAQAVTYLSQNFSLYAQDTWKLSSRLTLTYGLRWDVNPPLKGKDLASYPFTVLGLDNPATMTLAPQGTPLYATTYENFAPRVGVAYQLHQKLGWETVLRGGGGAFYDLGSGALGDNSFDWPVVKTKPVFFVPIPLSPTQAAPPVLSKTPPVSSSIIIADPRLKLPRTYQWNIAVEQALGAKQTVSATYVAALGRDLLRFDALNSPNPNFTRTVSITRNTATSDYDAFQLKFQRRISRGLQALASYTWSHSIDIASSDSAYFNGPSTLFGPNRDRGNSAFDVRHSVSGALTYDVPFRFKSRITGTIFNNWSMDDFLLVRSALPVDATGGSFVVSGTFFNARPDVVSGFPLYLYGTQYPGGKILNNTPNQGGAGCLGPYCPPVAGQQGSLGRNVLRGFGAWQDDFAVRRQFHLTEKVSLQLRTEFFNVFNHPNFGPPVSDLGSSLFGLSTQTLASSLGSGGALGGFNPLYQIGGPRSIQFALKLQF